MPVYEYRCTKCEREEQQFSNKVRGRDETRKCPECGGKMGRIDSTFNFFFKGGSPTR